VLNTELRPLGAGELLDRAVTLFVRRFVPIVIVLAIAIIPLMIVQALISPNAADMMTNLGSIFTAASNPAGATKASAAIERYNSSLPGIIGFSFIAAVVRLLMWSAIVAVIAAAYTSDRVTTPRDAYVIGANCWPAQLLVGLAFMVGGGVCAVPLFVVYFVIVIIVVGLAAANLGIAAAIFGVIAGIALLAAAAVFGSFVFMTYELAATFVVTESPNAIAAIQTAIRRVSSRATFWRTVVAGLVVFAITQGLALPVAFIAGFLSAITHVSALYYAILGTGTIVLDGLVASFVVVYATDVRIRREGLDLIALTMPDQPQPVPG
jgi:hypothetical protein